MLKRLYIDNYKCLVNFEIKPDQQIACLVGHNGGGKSAVFNALYGLQQFLVGGALAGDAFPQWTRTRWEKRPGQRIELDVQGSNGTAFRYELELRHDEPSRQTVVEREVVSSGGALLYEHLAGEIRLYGEELLQPSHPDDELKAVPLTAFPGDTRRSFLPLLQARPGNALLSEFKEWLSRM
jgi:energy-coupling factor transporter ATP-binding protein EcfA2